MLNYIPLSFVEDSAVKEGGRGCNGGVSGGGGGGAFVSIMTLS
jgi:hypothetical protein